MSILNYTVKVPTTTDLLIIHDHLERQVMAIRTYILSKEYRLAKQSLAHANLNMHSLLTNIEALETTNESEN